MHCDLSSSWLLSSVRSLAAAVLLIASTFASAAVIPVFEDGMLIGADNVQVGSLGLFNVRIARGACTVVLANACDPRSFVFTTPETALQAGQALLDQVFVGYYDDVTSGVRGCNENGCQPMIPYAILGLDMGQVTAVAYTSNWPAYFTFPGGFSPTGYPDEVRLGTGPVKNYPGYNGIAPLWAVWERQNAPVSVPEPSSLANILGGLLLAAALRSRSIRR